MVEPDVIIRYSNTEFRRFLMESIGVLRPDALRQIIEQAEIFPANDFRQLVEYLLQRYCSRFVRHMEKWKCNIPDGHPTDTLGIMIWYHTYWESWRSSEPWGDSEGRPIKYFWDTNFNRRLREADAHFPDN